MKPIKMKLSAIRYEMGGGWEVYTTPNGILCIYTPPEVHWKVIND